MGKFDQVIHGSNIEMIRLIKSFYNIIQTRVIDYENMDALARTKLAFSLVQQISQPLVGIQSACVCPLICFFYV